jgi:DNA (cytosine-5)-methyltransferase 1
MRLLDGFCGEGGAAMGYHRAGFDEIVGVDDLSNNPNAGKRYPFTFVQGDALKYLREHGHEFDAIHMSPPCQGYSNSRHVWKDRTYPMLIPAVREILQSFDVPYVIESVKGAKKHMIYPIMLKGTMFDLMVFRERLFESNVFLVTPMPLPNRVWGQAAPVGRPVNEHQRYITVTGHFNQSDGYAKRAMGIDWMTRKGLAEAIPPMYTQWIGTQLIEHIKARRVTS